MKKIVLSLVIIIAIHSVNASPFNLEFMERMRTRGQYYDLAISSEETGDRLYLATKLGIEVYSLENPGHPVLEGKFATPGLANGVAVNHPFVYVGDVYGLSIWDITDLDNPIMRSSVKTDREYGYQERVYYRDGLVYIAAYTQGVQIIDVANPDFPVLVGHAKADAYAWDLALSDQAIYIMDFFSMAIVDIRHPRFPVKRKTMNMMFAHGAAIRGNHLFLGYVDGLRIMDISDPFNPVDVSDMGPTGDGTGLTVSLWGNYAYVGHGSYIEAYDISNVRKPKQVAYFYPPGNPRKLLAHKGYLYTVLDDSGFVVTNVTDPRNPFQEVHIGGGEWGNRLDAVYDDETLYLVDWSRGLVIYDASQPDSLVELCTLPIPGSLRQCIIRDQTAYLVGQGEIFIVDISDREYPEILGNFRTSGRPYTITVDTELQRIYLCDLYGFFILDISNPADIKRIGAIWLAKEGNPYEARVIGRYAFIANGWKGIKVIDISNPSDPELALVWPGDNSKSYVSVTEKDGLLYFLNPSRGIDIITVSNPLAPELIASMPFEKLSINKFYLDENLIYLAAGTDGVFIYSITNPTMPILVGCVDTPGDALGLGFSNDRVFIADLYDLSVYKRLPFAPDRQAPNISIRDPKPLSWLENKTFVISGRAQDGQSGVRMVEISMDSGQTWQEAFGQTNWSFIASGMQKGPVSIRARAHDWSGNISSETADIWCYFNPPSPHIFVAGFEQSKVAAGKPAKIIINALVQDPWDEVYIKNLDVLVNGQSIEYELLERLESPGYIFFRLMFEHVFHHLTVPQVNLIAEDAFGNPSMIWPQVNVRW